MNLTLTEPDVFVSTPGAVLRLAKPADSAFHVYFYGQDGGDALGGQQAFITKKCIITGISDSSKENVQFRNTLSNFIFMYSFGSQISEMQVQGIAFLNPECDGQSGVAKIYDFFNRNKVSVSGKPLTMTMVSFNKGREVTKDTVKFRPFLIGMNVTLNDASNHLANFTLSLARAP